MSSKPAKPIQTQPKRDLYTPKPRQSRVFSRHIDGESNRTIAREEGIDRATVSRILSQQEIVTMLAEQQSQLLRMGSSALAVYQEALDSEDLGLAVATATKVLEGTGVINKERLQDLRHHASQPPPKRPPTPALEAGSQDRTEEKGGE